MTPPSPTDDWKHQTTSLRRLAAALVGHGPDAEDLVQEALLAGWQRAPEPAPLGWLRSVLRSRAVDLHRRQGRRGPALAVDPGLADENAPMPSSVAEHLEVQQALLAALQELPSTYRDALYLRYFEDLGPTAIAARLEVPVKTIKSQLSRGLERLHERLDRDPKETEHLRLSLALFAAGAPLTGPSSWLAASGATTAVLSMKFFLSAVAVILAGLAGLFLWTSGAEPRDLASAEVATLPPSALASGAADATRPSMDASASYAQERRSAKLDHADPSGEMEGAPEAQDRLAPVVPWPSGALAVHVIWHDGAAAEGVTLIAAIDRSAGASQGLRRRITDELGSARFEGLEPGLYGVSVDRGARWSPPVQAEVAAGAEATLRIALERGVEVTGYVHRDDGSPVADAGVWLTSIGAGKPDSWTGGRVVTRTDAAGGFRLRDVPATGSLGAIADGFAPSALVDLDLATVVEGAATVEIVLDQGGGALEGHVRSEYGQPVAGALVAATRGTAPYQRRANLTGQESWTPRTVRTNDDGAFRMQGLGPGRHEIYVRANGQPLWSGDALVQSGASTSLEVTLQSSGEVAGIVVDAAGQPVAGAHVRLEQGEPAPLADGPGGSPFVLPQTTSDEDGRFRLKNLAPGAHELRAGLSGTTATAEARVLVVPGETAIWDPILDEGAVIVGTLLYADRSPATGMFIDAVAMDGRDRATATVSNGAFRLEGLRGAAYELTLQSMEPLAAGRVFRRTDVLPSPKTVEWILDVDPPVHVAPYAVRLRFEDDGRRVVEGGQIGVMLHSEATGASWIGRRDRAEQAGEERVGEESRWRINMRRAGTFIPIVHLGSRVIASGDPVELDGQGDVELGALRSRPGASLLLKITRPKGLEDASATLELFVEASPEPEVIELGTTAAYRLENVEPGRLRLRLQGDGFVPMELALDAAESADFDVPLEVAPAASVPCIVTRGPDSRSAPIKVTLQATASGTTLWTTLFADSAGASGPYAFTLQVPIGSSSVTVEAGAGHAAARSLDVSKLDDPLAPLAFDLR